MASGTTVLLLLSVTVFCVLVIVSTSVLTLLETTSSKVGVVTRSVIASEVVTL